MSTYICCQCLCGCTIELDEDLDGEASVCAYCQRGDCPTPGEPMKHDGSKPRLFLIQGGLSGRPVEVPPEPEKCGARDNYREPMYRACYPCHLPAGHAGGHEASDSHFARGDELSPEEGCAHEHNREGVGDRCWRCGLYLGTPRAKPSRP